MWISDPDRVRQFKVLVRDEHEFGTSMHLHNSMIDVHVIYFPPCRTCFHPEKVEKGAMLDAESPEN